MLKNLLNKAASKYPSNKDIVSELKAEIENQRRQTAEITARYNEMLDIDRAKTEFFWNISHEFKTPISVILGSIQLMEQQLSSDSPDRSKARKNLEIMKHNCHRLLRLLTNILDMGRIDAGRVKLSMINCNIVSLVEEITQSVIPYAEQKGLSLIFDTESEEVITGVDIDKIERMILNLLSNAIKFTGPGGSIWVKVRRDSDNIVISVKDTGLGIPLEMQNMIFERFRQVNNPLTKDYEGSGLGLSIVKSFVELHEGSIKVISEENKGSEFIIQLPIGLCEADTDTMFQKEICQSKIINTINIEFSDIYTTAPKH